jgi:hypothetical protein
MRRAFLCSQALPKRIVPAYRFRLLCRTRRVTIRNIFTVLSSTDKAFAICFSVNLALYNEISKIGSGLFTHLSSCY